MEIIKDRINDEMEVFSNLIKTLNSYNIKYKIKGNILLHFIQYSKDYNDYFRGTRDLDLDTEYKHIDSIVDMFKELEPMCVVLTTKENIVRRISNLSIYNIEYVDINSKENIIVEDEFTEKYSINGEEFFGNSIEGIFKDKIATISTQSVQRRFKDVIDLFILKNMLLINDNEFIKILNKYKKGNFEYLKGKNTIRAMMLFDGLESNDQSGVEDAYNSICMLVDKLLDGKKELGSGGFVWD